MMSIRALPARSAWVTVTIALAVWSCSPVVRNGPLGFNQRPSVELTQAPARADSTQYSYAYRIYWSGDDPDGQIDHFEYAIDPPSEAQVAAGRETSWVRTLKHDELVRFASTRPDSTLDPIRPKATDHHTFVIRAVDNSKSDSRYSEPISRSFYTYTVAPEVQIVSPRPNAFFEAQVGLSVTITWAGFDPDGSGQRRPVQYRYLLLGATDPRYGLARSVPDSLLRFSLATGFAGWDSLDGTGTSVRYTQLTPGTQHVFIVVAKDEAGAYSAGLSSNTNMLAFHVGFPQNSGPRIVVGNEFFNYMYPSGGYTMDAGAIVRIELPPQTRTRINWYAEPRPGAGIDYYRWAVDIEDLTDETPRNPESTDQAHWSRKSPSTTFAEIGPFEPRSVHTLYIEAADTDGLKSLAIVRLEVVAAYLNDPVLGRELLIVDDTRLEADKFGPNGCPNAYTREWPSAAELDTFLYARGGKPWRCTRTPTAGVVSQPGLFAGYAFDTLGTRRGFEIPSFAVKLERLSRYRHIIWLTDASGIQNLDPTSLTAPITALHFISRPGQMNTIAAYMALGGKVWFVGGGISYMSLISYDRSSNNGTFGALFDHPAGELVAGRMMYDFVHWRTQTVSGTAVTNVLKSPRAVGGWSHQGFGGGLVSSPDYSLLPEEMRQKNAALGDVAPPTRIVSQQNRFYTYNSREVEYLTTQNHVREDIDPDPAVIRTASVLDTLMILEGGNLKNSIDPRTGALVHQSAAMTYYHGLENAPVVFSGFNVWSYSRTDCLTLVDFVLQRIWGLPRQNVLR